MLSLFRNKDAPILLGLDITGTSVKLLALSKTGDQFQVESYAVISLPPQAVVEKEIKQPEVVTDAIIKGVSFAKTSLLSVAVAVPDACVTMNTLYVSAGLSEVEMENVILSEVDQYIPYPLEEAHLDFECIGSSATRPNTIDVLWVASHTEHVDTRVAVIEDAGLSVEIVDVESFAMARAHQFLTAQGVTEATLFDNMTLAPQVKAAALRCDASALMMSCGLALRSFDT